MGLQLIVFFFLLPFWLGGIYLICEAIPPYSKYSKHYRPPKSEEQSEERPVRRSISLRSQNGDHGDQH